jgi:ATP-dependent DNA ligase
LTSSISTERLVSSRCRLNWPVSVTDLSYCLCVEQPLLKKQLHERRSLLKKHFIEIEGEFAFAKSSDGESSDEIQAFLEESVKDSCEGLMVKMLETADSTYEPSRRSMNWLKVRLIF